MKLFSNFLRKTGLALAAALLVPVLSFAQKTTVSGVVLDDGGVPVPGAVVLVKGNTSINAITGADGSFKLDVPAGSTIEVSCVGFVTHTFAASAGNQTITLMSDIQSLEETVVVGYGTQKKATLTGAITNIGEKAITATTTSDLATKLQGKVSGLNIRNNSGQPGSYDQSINIRGFGSPLYIIDGINRTAGDFQRLNAEDIESITVLKDASAAIYGLNASNGVLIVTTKKGSSYGKANLQFNTNVGVSFPTDYPKMANGYQYWYLRQQANMNSGLEDTITPEELEMWRTGEYKSTDWYAESFKKASIRQEYSLSADGGNDKVQYYMNVNYIKNDGMLKSGDLNYDKWSFRSNIRAKITKELTAAINVSGYTDKSLSPGGGFFAVWRGATNTLPYKSVYANNREGYWNAVKDGQSYNPVALSRADQTGYSQGTRNSISAIFSLSYVPTWLPDLEVKGTVSYDKLFQRSKSLTKAWSMYSYNDADDSYKSEEWGNYNISSAYTNTRRLTTQLQATYQKTIAKAHNIAATFVWETRSMDQDYDNIYKEFDFFSNDQLDYAATNDKMKAGGNESQQRNMSFIGRLNYDFKGRYLVELAARYDGSYRYHPDVRWGLFPVASIGWRISEEPFMKNLTWLSNLKLRASAGMIGQDAGSPFQYIAAFSVSGGGWAEFVDGKTTEGVSTPDLVNEKLTWTKSNIYNIGLDAAFLDNTLSFTVDVFRKHQNGILAYRNVSLPNTFGGSFPQENLNSNRTQGIEFSVGYQNRIGDFFYNINGNATWARTMNWYIEHGKPADQWSEYRGASWYRWTGMAWIYNEVGQFQNEQEIAEWPVYSTSRGMQYVLPGDWKYEDVNGDGVIDGDDTRPISLTNGAMPIWNFGLNLSGSWRGLDVNILFQGAAGAKTYHDLTYTTPFWQEANIPVWFMDAWHHADPFDPTSEWVPGSLPSVRTGMYGPYLNQWASQKSYMDASYVRLKNVEIGYTFSQDFMKKAHIDKLRVFISGQNLYTFCNKYVKPYDPETTSGNANTGWVYPLMMTFNAGLNLYF